MRTATEAWSRGRRLARWSAGFLAAGLLAMPAALAAEPVGVAYLERRIERPNPLNNEDPVPADEGLKGAELGLRDSNATGRFVGLSLSLTSKVVEPGGDIRAALAELLAGKDRPQFVVVNAPAADLLALADAPEAKDLVLLNVGATDTALRDAECRKDRKSVV